MSSMDVAGALLFSQFAYPPNSLGYCGPDVKGEILERVDSSRPTTPDDGGLRRLAAEFEGAWPYLELIAHANGVEDPLDVSVVEAYWMGNSLLDRLDLRQIGDSLEARFRPRLGADWRRLEAVVHEQPRPHHNFHVLCVYPWTGLLRGDTTEHALSVLDRCRIKSGRVEAVAGTLAMVSHRPLRWDGRRLALGEPQTSEFVLEEHGLSLAESVAPGDAVALHWHWVCRQLAPEQDAALRRETSFQLAFANRLAVPGPAAVL